MLARLKFNKYFELSVIVALPIYLQDVATNPRTVDMTGVTFGYLVSHSEYDGDTDYEHNVDRTLTLTNLESQSVQLEVVALSLQGNANDDCTDSLTITTSDPALPIICSDTPDIHTATLSSAEMSLQFQTNTETANDGFLLKFIGE